MSSCTNWTSFTYELRQGEALAMIFDLTDSSTGLPYVTTANDTFYLKLQKVESAETADVTITGAFVVGQSSITFEFTSNDTAVLGSYYSTLIANTSTDKQKFNGKINIVRAL